MTDILTKSRLSRIAAFAAAGILVVFSLWSVFSLMASAGEQVDEVDRRRALLSRMEAVVRQRAGATDTANGTAPQDPFLQAGNSSAAAAQLQDHLTRELQSIGIVPRSMEVRFPDGEPGLPAQVKRAQIAAEFDFLERDTGSLLKIAESAYPAFKLDRIDIRESAASRGENADVILAEDWRRLSATLVVSGYWLDDNAR